MTDLLPSLDELKRRLKELKGAAKRTAKLIAKIESRPDMYLQTNALGLMGGSLRKTFAYITELERLIMLEESRNTTRRESAAVPHA